MSKLKIEKPRVFQFVKSALNYKLLTGNPVGSLMMHFSPLLMTAKKDKLIVIIEVDALRNRFDEPDEMATMAEIEKIIQDSDLTNNWKQPIR